VLLVVAVVLLEVAKPELLAELFASSGHLPAPGPLKGQASPVPRCHTGVGTRRGRVSKIEDKFLAKVAADLATRLTRDEKVLTQSSVGFVGASQAMLVLTSHRVLLFTALGRLGSLKIAETRLDTVREAHYNAARLGPDHHTLFVISRQGDLHFRFGMGAAAQQEGAGWPGLILEARSRAVGAATPPPPVSTDDLATQLQTLSALHASGALTAEEFAAAKQKLIG